MLVYQKDENTAWDIIEKKAKIRNYGNQTNEYAENWLDLLTKKAQI